MVIINRDYLLIMDDKNNILYNDGIGEIINDGYLVMNNSIYNPLDGKIRIHNYVNNKEKDIVVDIIDEHHKIYFNIYKKEFFTNKNRDDKRY
jgi:hypothetical protein